ncbi:N-acetylmuramoyl-L-alanine amidase [Primorskyibacter sp. S187A]|uniref:N-acetylmuramoyl-L-alanine amidase n=1 Tax=Primorskyibacter sp. S187A TaxID=3415130 RepID=UPI003C7E6793
MRDANAVWHPSPNAGARRAGLTPHLIVLHYTAMASAERARDWLCNPEAQVSAHYVLARDGTLWQLVDETERAWHAGAGEWRGQDDINSRSIGIEIANTGAEPFPEPQMAALEALMGRIKARWDITETIGHSDMAIGRKIDPGPRFDWARLARQGLAHGVGQGPTQNPTPAQFRAAAKARGYSCDASDDALLHAVRMRFRPWARGSLCAADMAVLAEV